MPLLNRGLYVCTMYTSYSSSTECTCSRQPYNKLILQIGITSFYQSLRVDARNGGQVSTQLYRYLRVEAYVTCSLFIVTSDPVISHYRISLPVYNYR